MQKKHYDAAVESLIASGQALALFHAPQMFEKKQIFNQRREQVVTALALWMRIHTQKTNSNQLEQQSQTQLVSVSKIESELQAAQALAPMLARDCASVEQTLQIAQLVASESAEGLREQLQAGLACPVCGGLEHPYAVHLPYQDAALIALKNNVTNKRNESQALITRIGILSSTLSSAQTQLEQLSATRLVSDNTTLKFQAEWVQHAMRAELVLVAENDIQVCLDSALVVITSHLEKLTAQEIGFQKALQEKETLQVAKDKSQLALQSQKETFDSLTQEQKINHQALQSVVQQIAELTPQIESTLLLISNGFVDARWQESWRQDASTFVAQCKKDVFSWNSKQKNSVEFFSHIQLLGNALESLTLALKKNIQTLTDQSDQCSHQELVLQIIREKRKALFDGKSTQDIEANFNNAVALARQAQTNFQLLSQQSSSQHTRLVEVTRQSVAQVVSSNYELSQAQTNFDVWCDSFQSRTDVAELGTSCSLEHLQRWLDVPLAWAVTERIELQEIDTALASAQAVLTQQSLNLTRHQAVCSTSEDVLSVANKLSELEKTLLAVSEALTALRIALAEDDKRLGATNDLRLKIQLQSTRTDLWARLGELIGSADGKKFRNFAQQMTLDILLGYANSHLQSLTKRYRLQRIKNSLGLLVVDQDMGDEVRSVHSLSGGESFLVSLALALGLASLSSHQVRVESLFIDEGFGSLDADALLLAMEALDKLQAQGRKVGVISHVQEMTERINTRVQVQRMAGGVSKVVVS
ncbi:SbcC/MukB-like Walker B domain-containing protein [Polaromonas vacuolata]|nr:SbcC/MukB-like Walker B domain-containing protein [Polaromonas vacuolata]